MSLTGRGTFTLLALATAVFLGGSAAAQQKRPDSSGPAASTNAKPASQWIKLCDPDCYLYAERLGADQGNVVIAAEVRLDNRGAAKHVLVLLPLGMGVPPGMRVSIYPKDMWAQIQKGEKVDDSKLVPLSLAYSHCSPSGCIATAPLTSQMATNLGTGGGIVVFAINSNGGPLAYRIGLGGYTETLAGPPAAKQDQDRARRAVLAPANEAQANWDPAKIPAALAALEMRRTPLVPQSEREVGVDMTRYKLMQPTWINFCDASQVQGKASEVCLARAVAAASPTQLISVAVRRTIPAGTQVAIMATVPLHVSLSRGLQIQLHTGHDGSKVQTGQSNSSGQPVTLPFKLCHPGGCFAEIANADLLSRMRAASAMTLSALTVTGETLSLTFPLEDFAAALDGPPTDNATFTRLYETFLKSVQLP